jgi:hypothetical protein
MLFRSLSELRKNEEDYKPRLIDNSNMIYSNTNNYDPVMLSFDTDTLRKKIVKQDERKLIDSKNLTLEVDRSEEIKRIPKPVNVHPNDPSLDVNPNQYNQQSIGPMYNQYIQPSSNYQNSYWYQQQKAREYQMGYNYLQRRGPMYYNFPDNPNIPILKQFQEDMNQKINDPSQIMNGSYNPNTQLGDSIIPVNEISEEEYRDQHYERENEQRASIAKSLKEKREFAVPKEMDIKSTPQKRMTHKERIEKMNNINTPMADIDKIGNHVLPSGEAVFVLSRNPKNQMFENAESANAFELAKQRYEQEKRAILGKSPLVQQQQYYQPRFYNPTDYNRYVNSTYTSRPYYNYGYGYTSVGGTLDSNGLPTTYFDDGGRYMTPTQQEIDEEKVPVIYLRGKKKTLKKKVINTTPGKITKFYNEVVDGKLVRRISDTVKGKWSDKEIDEYYERYGFRDYKFAATGVNPDVSNNTYFENYANMYQDAIDQNNNDDTSIMCLELARYNKELASMYGWLRNILEQNEFIKLKQQCLDFLYDVRNIDVFCLIKSSVIISKNQVISLKSKPTDDNEIKSLTNEFEKVIENVIKSKSKYTKKLDIISMKLNNIISTLKDTVKSVKDKVVFLKSLRDIELIPIEENKAYKYAKQVMDSIPEYKKANYVQYRFWRSIKVKDTLESEKAFSTWWNKPRRRMNKAEYEKAYNLRMQELSMNYLDYVQKNNLGYDPIVMKQKIDAYNDWIRLSEGRFNKPIKSFADYIKACNVTEYNINKEKILREQVERIKKTKTNTELSQQCILDKVIEKNTERMGYGESFVQKFPRYAPVSLSGIGDDNLDVETRRKRFIERIFKSVKRPSIT